MPLNEQPDQEPEVKPEVTPTAVVKGRQSFSRVRRELSDEELASPAVQRLLIDEIERLERDCSEFRDYRDRYHTADTKAQILEVRLKKSLAGEIIFGVCFSLAGAAFGYAPAVWNQPPTGEIAVSFGLILTVTGIVARIVQR
jgi:hypothetical protein